MLIREFTPEWKLWIWQNIVNGIPKENLFNVLLNYGYEYSLIQKEMDYEPVNPLVWKRQYSQAEMGPFGDETILPLNRTLSDNFQVYRIDTNLIEMYYLPEFILPQDCKKLIEDTDGTFNGINETLHRITGIDKDQSGDLFLDEVDPESLNLERVAEGTEWEMIIFLNDVKEGGELVFPKINKSFTPTEGHAVIWRLLYPSGNVNPNAEKHEKDIPEGLKFTLHKFFKRPEMMAQVINLEMEKL